MHKCLIISGMHRSGTSALAGALNKMGITMGSRLIKTTEDNEKGFFENLDVYELNEGMLKTLNASWDDLFFLEEDWWKQSSLHVYRDRIIEIVEKQFSNDTLFGIKDPRLSILFPLWSSVFEQLAIETLCIIPVRHPLEVGDSLKKRNGFSIEKSAFLWMKHMLFAEHYSRPCRRVFVSFDDLLTDPERTLDRISNVLDVRYPKSWQEAQGGIGVFLDRSIKHHTRLDDARIPGFSSLIEDTYRLLMQFSTIDAIANEELANIDTIRTAYIEAHTSSYDERIGNIDEVTVTDPDSHGQTPPPEIGLHEGEGEIREQNMVGGLVEPIGGLKSGVPGMVTVIVVNYNGRNYLESCFQSLLNVERDTIPFEIVMVDNLSEDDSVRFVKSKFHDIRVVINDLNNFARALNLGIRNASGEYIAFLNNDVRVERNWLKGLLDVMRRDEKIGAVQSKILFSEGGAINSAGVEEVADSYFRDIGFREEDSGQYEEVREIDYFSGGSVLLRRSCLESTGEIDEDFIMFFEDIDFSIRSRKRGWRILYSPASVVHHRYHGAASSEIADFFCSRNRFLYIAKHFPSRLPMSIKTSTFYRNNEHDNLFQSLIQAVKKLIGHHTSEVSMSVIGELRDVIADVFGDPRAYEFFSCVEVMVGLKNIRMGIYDNNLQFSRDELPVAGSLIDKPSFYLRHNTGLMRMAATLDKPVIAVFNRVEGVTRRLQECESDRRLRLEQIHELTGRLRDSETDRASRFEQISELTRLLKESEADRTSRFEQISELTRLLEESEADRAARLEVMHRLEAELAEQRKKVGDLEKGWGDVERTFAVRLARRVGLIKARRFDMPANSSK